MLALPELCALAVESALKLGTKDVSAISERSDHSMVRIANNSVSIVKKMASTSVTLYLSRNKRRIVGSTYNPTPEGVKKFVSELFKASKTLSPSPDYAPLPKGPFKYRGQSPYDRRIVDAGERLVDFAKDAVDSALEEGANRVAGALSAYNQEFAIQTSAGASSQDRVTKIFLNVRAFADSDASGQGLSCAANLDRFNPAEAGRTAGRFAKQAANPQRCEEGRYDVIMGYTVAASIMQLVADLSSAFVVDAGLSFLAEKLGKKVAVRELILKDSTVVNDGIETRAFDDEGVPTAETSVISKGVLKAYLHNTTTAKKFKTKSTGNAGIIAPRLWNVVVDPGDSSIEEMIKSVKRGVYVTNNWYTRFQNYRSGEYSTVPRDATFLIENGEIKKSIAGIRISGTLPRQLLNIAAISRDRRWVKWWDEVAYPTLSPALLIKDVPITSAQL